jgi:cell division protein FtsN
MNLPEMPPQRIAQAEQEILSLPQIESFSESPESIKLLLATDEATETVHRQSSRLRVLRASPIILAFCGIVFISLIFVMDFTAQDHNRAATVSRTSSAIPAKTVNLPAGSGRDQKVTASAPAASAPQPSVAPTVQSPSVESASPATASNVAADASAGQLQAPVPSPPTNNDSRPAQANVPLPTDSAGEGDFTLQVGSFNASAEADERVAKLVSLGVRAYVVRVELPKRGTWYRIHVGRFSSREEAGRYGAQLRGKGAVADFIVTDRRAT